MHTLFEGRARVGGGVARIIGMLRTKAEINRLLGFLLRLVDREVHTHVRNRP